MARVGFDRDRPEHPNRKERTRQVVAADISGSESRLGRVVVVLEG